MDIPVPTWGYILWTIFFCLFLDRQPAGHGFSRAVFHAAGLSRQPAAGHQPLPDERTFARAARAWARPAATFRTTSSASRRLPSRFSPSAPPMPFLAMTTLLRKAAPWLQQTGFARSRPHGVPRAPGRQNQAASACSVFRGRPVRCSRKSAANSPDLLPEIVVDGFQSARP